MHQSLTCSWGDTQAGGDLMLIVAPAPIITSPSALKDGDPSVL